VLLHMLAPPGEMDTYIGIVEDAAARYSAAV
jgi:hypothetical protein